MRPPAVGEEVGLAPSLDPQAGRRRTRTRRSLAPLVVAVRPSTSVRRTASVRCGCASTCWSAACASTCGTMAALDPHASYVFMSNHRSQFDILAVVAALPEFQLRWVAKKELTRVPIFGWALRHTGPHHHRPQRPRAGDGEPARGARADGARASRSIIFPEGTRAPATGSAPALQEGRLHAGARDRLSDRADRRARQRPTSCRRGAWRAAGGDLEVIVGRPIPVTGVDRDELMQRVRTFMLEAARRPRGRGARRGGGAR